MARRTDPQVFVATQSGSAEVDGENMTFVKGVTRVRKGHRLLEQLPSFFEAADEHLNYEEEAADAGPGVKRDAVVVGETPEATPEAPATPEVPR